VRHRVVCSDAELRTWRVTSIRAVSIICLYFKGHVVYENSLSVV